MPVTLRRQFEQEQELLQQDVLWLGAWALEMLDQAALALERQDTTLAERVIAMDDEADRMYMDLEHRCFHLLASQQPVSRDLREISSALKVVTDLERIGDFAVDIAKTTRRLAGEPYFKPAVQISRMVGSVQAIIRHALQAYGSRDLEEADRVIAMDDVVDAHYDRIFTELMEWAARSPACYQQAVWLTHVIHFLERMGDHAVNVAERVHYMETGHLPRQAGRGAA